MTLRDALISAASAICLASPALASGGGEQGPHRSLVIGGDCVECTFEGANLAGAQFLGGDFRDANFDRAEMLGARLVDLTLQGASFERASLNEVHIANSGLEGANFENATLTRARFHQARLVGANLSDASMSQSVMLLVDLTGANLSNVAANSSVFRQANFSATRLRDAGLSNAHFIGSRLIGADARNANFSGSIFENVDLTGSDFRDTNLVGVRFRTVDVTGVDFRNANGLSSSLFARACGVDARGLPDDVELGPCGETRQSIDDEEITVAVAASREALENLRQQRRAQIEEARHAFEQAIGSIEVRVGSSDRIRLEAIAAAREGWEAAAEALAEAEFELAENGEEMNWSFDIRRAELGEPIRIILEQAVPQDVVVFTRRETMEAPPPPPMPEAPKLPQRADAMFISEDGTTITRDAEIILIERSLSAADIGFLIEATANDFNRRDNAETLSFRDVQAGVWARSNETQLPILCGDVELEDGWTRFATVRSEGFEISLGGSGEAICDGDAATIQPSADLAIRIERRLTQLAVD